MGNQKFPLLGEFREIRNFLKNLLKFHEILQARGISDFSRPHFSLNEFFPDFFEKSEDL